MSDSITENNQHFALDPQASLEEWRQLANQSVKCARLIASYTMTPVKLLQKLMEHPDQDVRCRVMGNPQTPWLTLLHFAEDYPEMLAQNPAMELCSLLDPALSGLKPRALLKILELDSPPAWAFCAGTLSADHQLRLAVVAHPQAPSILLLKLMRVAEQNLTDFETKRNRQAQQNRAMGLEVRREKQHEQEIRCQAARHPNYPQSDMSRLAEDVDELVRRSLALNPNCPLEIIERLLQDPSLAVCENAGEHPTFAQELTQASSPQLSPQQLQELAAHRNLLVRFAVARNPKTPGEALVRLANDPYHRVRWAVAGHPNTFRRTLHKLVQDPNSNVWEKALEHPAIPEVFLVRNSDSQENYTRRIVAQNPATPPAILDKLAQDAVWIVRCAVARNPNLKGQGLAILAHDENSNLRLNIAQHSNAHLAVLQQLAADKVNVVREAAQARLDQLNQAHNKT